MIRPISISLSPNTERDDVRLAFKLLFQPWLWRKKPEDGPLYKLGEELKKYLAVKHVFSFNSGRSSLMAILNSLELNPGDEVLLQAFTCNAVPNPVLWTGLKPVYVDVDEKNFNIDIEDLKHKITSRSKVVIVQHTFGAPADMDEIVKICQENNLILIEDCAHALGAKYKGKSVGTFGGVALFSFSRDKVISSVYGGMVATNDLLIAEKVRQFQDKCGYPPYAWIFQQLLHPVLMSWLILPTYRIFGKYLLVLFQWFHVLSKAVHWKEKRGLRPGYFPKRMPDALAILALNQFKKLERFNLHRKEIAEFYSRELSNTKYKILDTKYKEGNVFLRFSARHFDAHKIIKKAWKNNLLIGDWYTSPIAPADTRVEKIGYNMGSCPIAEKLAKETLNLPTHINISESDAQKIVNFLNRWK